MVFCCGCRMYFFLRFITPSGLLANSLVEWTSVFETFFIYLFILCEQIFSFYTVQILTFADDSSLTLKATKLANSLVYPERIHRGIEWTSVGNVQFFFLITVSLLSSRLTLLVLLLTGHTAVTESNYNYNFLEVFSNSLLDTETKDSSVILDITINAKLPLSLHYLMILLQGGVVGPSGNIGPSGLCGPSGCLHFQIIFVARLLLSCVNLTVYLFKQILANSLVECWPTPSWVLTLPRFNSPVGPYFTQVYQNSSIQQPPSRSTQMSPQCTESFLVKVGGIPTSLQYLLSLSFSINSTYIYHQAQLHRQRPPPWSLYVNLLYKLIKLVIQTPLTLISIHYFI